VNRPNSIASTKSAPRESGMLQLQQCAQALQKLSYLWTTGTTSPLAWDQQRRVFSTSNAGRTYQTLFGKVPARWVTRAHLFARAVRRGESVGRRARPVRLDIELPFDAVIFPRKALRNRQLLVLASASEGVVLKLAFGNARTSLQRERTALQLAQDAGIGDHVPRFIESGEMGAEGEWHLLELMPNTHPPPFDTVPTGERPQVVDTVAGSRDPASNAALL